MEEKPTRRDILLSGLLILTIIIGGVSYASRADALPKPICIGLSCGFGGVIEEIKGCTCIPTRKVGAPSDLPVDYGKLIKVTPPKGGEFMIIDGFVSALADVLGIKVETTIYDYKKIKEDHWVLGLTKNVPIPCYQIDKAKTTLCLIASFFGACTPKIICTESKGDGWYVTKIGTGGVPASQTTIQNLQKLIP